MNEKQKFRTTIGGQAIIEGIMMLGPKKSAIVVRAPEGLVSKEEDVKFIKDRYPILGWPVIRGAVGFMTSMKRGISALMFSAEYYPDDESLEPSKLDLWIERHFTGKAAQNLIMGVAMFFGLAMPILLFFFLPAFLTAFFSGALGTGTLRALTEGIVRLVIFFLFMYFVSKMRDIKRVFSYHGAEHKTIFCYEAGEELTVENVRRQPKEHPRCGTSFLLVVMIISLVVYAVFSVFFTISNPVLRMLFKLALLPLIVGLSYELNRLVGRYDNPLTRFLRMPGLWFQRFTTVEPDDSMIEVGILALKLVIPEEKGEDKW